MEIDELQLVESVQAGDYSGFAQLYDAYIKQIYNFIYFRTHHQQNAEDLTSAVFMKALDNIRSFRPDKGKFSTWLYQIARNTVIDHYRSQHSTQDIQDAWDIASPEDVVKDADVSLKRDQIKEILQQLPKQQQDIVIMRVWDGLSHQEIADILNISPASSKMGFSRAVSKIQKEALIALLIAIVLMK